MPKAKKLPSGSWRVQVYAGKGPDGRQLRESFTAPTKKEAEYLAAQWQLQRSARPADQSLGDAINAYIRDNTGILSPSTIVKYQSMRRSYFGPIESVPLRRVTSDLVQGWISTLALRLSPKSTACVYGLLTATLAQYVPDLSLHVRLPRRVPQEMVIPSPEDVACMIAEADDVFRPVLVIASSMGLRRAEISALTWADVRGDSLRINKAYTKGPDGLLVLHAPKTNAGIRTLPIPPAAAPCLTRPAGAPDDARITLLSPDAITRRFERLCARLGFHYRFHSLRHYYDSVLCSLGVPDKYIMQRMGHATPAMTKQVYQHIMRSRDEQITDAINEYFK